MLWLTSRAAIVATIYKRNSTYWVRFQWHGTATVLPILDAI